MILTCPVIQRRSVRRCVRSHCVNQLHVIRDGVILTIPGVIASLRSPSDRIHRAH